MPSAFAAAEVWGARPASPQPIKMRMPGVMSLDHSLAIFRRFEHIHIQSLLHSQAKLVALEQRLNNLPDHHPERPELLDIISSELNLYHRQLLHYSQTHNLPQPRPTFVRTLKDWVHDHDVAENVKFLDDKSDLVAVVPPQDNGILFRFLEDLLQKFLAWRRVPSSGTPYVYDDASIRAVVRCLMTLAAAVLLLIPIVILSFVHGKKQALIVIVLFTMGFSVTLSVFTGGKNHELMEATAAYTAVMVVFVGTNT